jgi:hypothetical protein
VTQEAVALWENRRHGTRHPTRQPRESGPDTSVGLAYVLLGEPVWHLPSWVTAAEFGPFVAGLLLAWWPRRDAVPPAIPDRARP